MKILIGPLYLLYVLSEVAATFIQITPDVLSINDLVSFGVGGVLSGVLLIWKRSDDQRYAENLVAMNARLMEALEQTSEAIKESSALLQQIADRQASESRVADSLASITALIQKLV